MTSSTDSSNAPSSLSTPPSSPERELVSAFECLPGGQYELLQHAKLGSGATSTVYLGRRTHSSRSFVAIKRMLLPEDAEGRERWTMWARREARLNLKASGHAGVLPIHDLIESSTSAALVFPMCDGDLFEALGRGLLKRKPGRLGRIVGDVLGGLAHLHSIGIAHRDLKAENVLVTVGGEDTARYQIADFGFATDRRTSTTFIGTMSSIAPGTQR